MAEYQAIPACSKCPRPATLQIGLGGGWGSAFTCPEHQLYFVIVYSPWAWSEVVEAAAR